MKPLFFKVKRSSQFSLAAIIALVLFLSAFGTSQAYTVPVISITAVEKDVNVTISGTNFPAGQSFTVRMGPYGTLGIGGIVVGTYASTGSAFTATYAIPSALAGSAKIAIRMDSAQGYYSYNWFYNNSTSPAVTATPTSTTPTVAPSVTATPLPVPAYTGIPTFNIIKIVKGSSVTIRTNNFPALQTFTARMGDYGTLGIGGIVVGSTYSGTGGIFEKTYTIPTELASNSRIAIRLDSPQGYYAFNWFDNIDYDISGTTATPVPSATATTATAVPTTTTPAWTPVPGYVGIPTFFIYSVVKDSKVTINAYNFPAGQTFTVRMGDYGTLGIGGIVVTTYDSGAGGAFTATFDIPASLAGSGKIAIRLETANGYYYSYNWFYNTTTN